MNISHTLFELRLVLRTSFKKSLTRFTEKVTNKEVPHMPRYKSPLLQRQKT